MKKIFIYFLSFLLLAGTSCSDVLDQKAVDSFDEDVVFSDVVLVKAYVGACYSLISGIKTDGQGGSDGVFTRRDFLTSATDHSLCTFRANQFGHLKGDLSPDNLGTFANNDQGQAHLRWTNLYANIQNLNTILSRIDEVPFKNKAEEDLLFRLKGEAYFLRALCYTHLLMVHGGVILSDKPYKMTDDFSTVKRSSISATKDFILENIASAIEHLPEKNEQGRANRATAAALKSRMLLFCASELTNGGWAEQASNELISFSTGSKKSLLEAARDAAKDIMDGKYGRYALVGNTSQPASPLTEAQIKEYADVYYGIFNQKVGTAWNSETIWGIQYAQKDGRVFQANLWNGPNGYWGYGNNCPTEELVRKYEMADGSRFVWNAANPDDKFSIRKATAAELAANPYLNPYYGREPRFYASILYHGAPWVERADAGKAYDSRNRILTGATFEVRGTDTIEVQRAVDTRQGYFNTGNGTLTGYYMKKYMDNEISGNQTQSVNNTNAWIEYRYAEVLLNYAEACIELGGADLQAGIAAMNLVRHRAGLPSRVTTNQDQAREYVRHEREIEFFGEGLRFFDMRRWMICNQVVVDLYFIRIMEMTDGGMVWYLNRGNRTDARTWGGSQFYWLPVPRGEINKVPGLQQNPGYN